MAGKATSAGTKVTENVPQAEPAGVVNLDSLAAESIENKGSFGENRGVHKENADAKPYTGTADASVSTSGQSSTANGASAPSYAINQHDRDTNSPHGRNLTEGGWDDSKVQGGAQKALAAEIGSVDDPARVAENKFVAGTANVQGGRDTKLDGSKGGYEQLATDVDA